MKTLKPIKIPPAFPVDSLEAPAAEVFLLYNKGKKKSVAMTDSLSQKEADYFQEKWSNPADGNVVMVTLERNGEVLETFDYYPF